MSSATVKMRINPTGERVKRVRVLQGKHQFPKSKVWSYNVHVVIPSHNVLREKVGGSKKRKKGLEGEN